MASTALPENSIDKVVSGTNSEPTKSEPLLTKEDVKYLQESWKVVAAEPIENGKKVFHRLFEQNPEIMKKFYFATRNNYDISKIMVDKKLISHAENVIKTVTLATNHLEDLGTLVPILLNLGAKHARLNPKEEHFNAVGEALIWVIQGCHSDGFDNSQKELWVKVYGVVSQTMLEGIKKARSVEKK